MSRSAVGRSRFFACFLVGFGTLLLSGCVSEEARKQGLIGLDKFEISAPEIGEVEGLDQVEPLREKVASVEISAPLEGDLLSSVRANIRSSYDSWNIGADYLLAGNMAPVVREASAYLFELDPDADKRVKITLTVDTSSSLKRAQSCAPWITTVTVKFMVAEIGSETGETLSSYEATALDTTCTTWVKLPLSGAVEEPLQEAFTKALLKAIQARRAGQEVTASASQ